MNIHDLATRIRNACMVGAQACQVRYSKFGVAVLEVLQKEGYINGFSFDKDNTVKGKIDVQLRYTDNEFYPVIRIIKTFRKGTTVNMNDIKNKKYLIDRFTTCILTTSEGITTYNKTKLGGTLLMAVSS